MRLATDHNTSSLTSRGHLPHQRRARRAADPPAISPPGQHRGDRFNRVLAAVSHQPFSEAMSLAATLGTHVRVVDVVPFHNAFHGGGFPFEGGRRRGRPRRGGCL
jgi:hypothetical protein